MGGCESAARCGKLIHIRPLRPTRHVTDTKHLLSATTVAAPSYGLAALRGGPSCHTVALAVQLRACHKCHIPQIQKHIFQLRTL